MPTPASAGSTAALPVRLASLLARTPFRVSLAAGPGEYTKVASRLQKVGYSRLMEAALARDGRNVRAERTRKAVVEALLELLDEGDVRPTAERIAVRAGVSERS